MMTADSGLLFWATLYLLTNPGTKAAEVAETAVKIVCDQIHSII